jgi:hypothetical protein
MGVPVAVFIAAFAAGAFAAARWLPAGGPGHVGDLAFFVVCTLLAIALEVYETVREVIHTPSIEGATIGKPDVLASGIATILRDVGPILGLAGAVYLLSPRNYRWAGRRRPRLRRGVRGHALLELRASSPMRSCHS